MNTYRGILNDHISFRPEDIFLQTTQKTPKIKAKRFID